MLPFRQVNNSRELLILTFHLLLGEFIQNIALYLISLGKIHLNEDKKMFQSRVKNNLKLFALYIDRHQIFKYKILNTFF